MFFHKMFKHVKKFKDQNCKLLGVSRDGPSVLKDWMDECGWPIPVISDMNLAPKDFGVIQRLGLPLQHGYAVPSAVVIDKKGVIRTIASHSPSDGGCCVGEILRIVTALNQVVVPGDNGKLTPANWDAKQPFIVNTRKGVDDYYYRKYGLREKKYWPSTRSESKGGINNDSKEKGAKSKQEDDEVGGADNNFLTGANDILAVEDGAGQLTASPFSVQFGKKDIWLPRSGHVVSLQVNSRDVPVSMVLDSAGRGYFSTRAREEGSGQYRFWSALLGMRDPEPKHRTSTATAAQLAQLGLQPGQNQLVYRVETSSGSVVRTAASLHLVSSSARIVVTDIDGTVTKSDIRGVLLPALGLSDWKHSGVVPLYHQISRQGYTLLYLTNRAIGQADMTRDYIFSLEEGGVAMPPGPVLLQIDSVVGALKTEVIKGQPELNKIVALSKIRGLFPSNPFVAGFGNTEWDILAYKALSIDPDMIFHVMEDSSLVVEGTGLPTSYSNIINNVTNLFPSNFS